MTVSTRLNPNPFPLARVGMAVAAVAVAAGIAIGVLLATGGSTPDVGSLTPLALDTDVTPGTVQLEPGDTPPPSAGGAGNTMLAGGPGISVAEALASTLNGPLLVNGTVVITDGEARLCSALAESFPPQCGGDAITVVGLDLATLDLQRADAVRWTDSPVQLLGFVREGVLVIDNAALAADGGAPPLLGDDS